MTGLLDEMLLTMEKAERRNRAEILLRAYLIGRGYAEWPSDPELTKIAARVGVSRTEAYRARANGPLHMWAGLRSGS